MYVSTGYSSSFVLGLISMSDHDTVMRKQWDALGFYFSGLTPVLLRLRSSFTFSHSNKNKSN